MKTKLGFVVFGVVVFLALFGGVWQTAVYAQTVPPTVPLDAGFAPVIPVTGGVCSFEVVQKDKPITVDVPKLADTGAAANVLKEKDKMSLCVVLPQDLPSANLVSVSGNGYISTVERNGVKLSVDDVGKYQEFSVYLSPAEVDMFSKNPDMGVLWFDSNSNTWTRVPAVLEEGVLTAKATGIGYFAFGTIK